jgi:hypothetical protein
MAVTLAFPTCNVQQTFWSNLYREFARPIVHAATIVMEPPQSPSHGMHCAHLDLADAIMNAPLESACPALGVDGIMSTMLVNLKLLGRST